MICSQCGNSLAEGSAVCPRCGTPVAGSATQGYGSASAAARSPAHGSPNAPQAFSFDAARWSQSERITGVATVLLLISLFLPWFSVSVSGNVLGHSVGATSGSVSGTTAHGYLWIVFILCLAIVAFLVLQAGFSSLPFQLPVAREMLLLGATGLNLLLVLIAFFLKPAGGGSFLGVSVGWSWSFGAFIALLAAIAACVPLALPMARARTAAQ